MEGLGIGVRRATEQDLAALYKELQQGDHELVDLRRAIVFVAEAEGKRVGFIAGRILVQVEPLFLFSGFRASVPQHRTRKVTAMLAQVMDNYLKEATSARAWGMGCYYAYIRDQVMQRLAGHFGLRPVYRDGGGWFLREFE